MVEGGCVDIRALVDLEKGIQTFGHQMEEANSEIEHTIDLYFHSFERGLQILEERLRKAEADLARAERALERQRSKRVWVEDDDGEGHWEQADCSAEEAAVMRCRAKCDKCRRDVETCRQMISDARSRRHIHEEKYSHVKSGISTAMEKIGPVKELVERHLFIQTPSSNSGSNSGSFPSDAPSTSSTYGARSAEMRRPRPPMNNDPSFGPAKSPLSERPRGPQKEGINPTPSRPVTEADRPRSPFGDKGRVTRDSVSSFREGIDKIFKKHKHDDTNE